METFSIWVKVYIGMSRMHQGKKSSAEMGLCTVRARLFFPDADVILPIR